MYADAFHMACGKDKRLGLTGKDQQTLFFKRCIDALRAVSAGTAPELDADGAGQPGPASR